MAEKSFVVAGEGSESDTEEEINYPFVKKSGPNTPKMNISSTHKGKIVIGEAPESDEELEVNVPLRATKLTTPKKSPGASGLKLQKNKDGLQFKTLLHSKLRETNCSLHKNLTDFILSNVVIAGRQMNRADQQLVDSQVHLQEAVSALNTLHSNSAILTKKLSSITSGSFLPNIIIPVDG